MKNIRDIYGVTPLEDVPGKIMNLPIVEICETDKISIPKEKPGVEEILELFLKITTQSHKMISTPHGKKLIINGTKHIKLIYMSSRSSRNVHSLVFEIPFCACQLLEHYGGGRISEIKSSVEYITVRNSEARCFCLSSVFTMYPVFHKQLEYNHSQEHREDLLIDNTGSDDMHVNLHINECPDKQCKSKNFTNLCSDNTSKCAKCKKTNCRKRSTKNKFVKGFEECSSFCPAEDDCFTGGSTNSIKHDFAEYSYDMDFEDD